MIAQAKLSPLGELFRDMTIRAHQEGSTPPTVGDAINRWQLDREVRKAYDPTGSFKEV